jgi:hypothetical protein
MTQKMAIRVTLGQDGRTPVRELMFNGHKVGDISYVELVDFIMQATSSLRFEVRRDG